MLTFSVVIAFKRRERKKNENNDEYIWYRGDDAFEETRNSHNLTPYSMESKNIFVVDD